jgi:plastocyanin
MRPPMIRRLLPLAVLLTLAASACATTPEADVEFGAGSRFVPLVADPLNNAGVDPSIVSTSDGTPVIAYFAFEEVPEEGSLPATRPVGSPSLPGVLMASVSDQGIFTRGAMAMSSQVANVNPRFAPGYDESVGKLTPKNVTGLQMVADGDTFHAAWGSSNGLYYATGALDPASTTQVKIEQVTKTPPHGLSIAVDGSGSPYIAYYTSIGSQSSVELATTDGTSWSNDSIADASIANCDTCRTAAATVDGGVAIAYVASTAGAGAVQVATNDGENGWTSFDVQGSTGGQGLSAAATPDGIALVYYDGTQLTYFAGSPQGPFTASSVADVDASASSAEGAGTSVAIADDGTAYLAWQDAGGVRFASGKPTAGVGEGEFTAIDTAPDTDGGQMPSVAVAPDGSRAFLAWYDTDTQDLLMGMVGDLTGLALANPSPTPSTVAAPPTTGGGQDCEPVTNGSVSVQAAGLAFDTPCIDASPGEAFKIEFGNQDAGTQHNIAIFTDDTLTKNLFKGELITGPASTTYDVPALDAGSYFFHCDVHPTMQGTIEVGNGGGATGASGASGASGSTGATGASGASGASGATGASGSTGTKGGGGGGGGATTTVVAQGIAFQTDQIQLAAGKKSTLTFDNRDAGVQHNIAIFEDESLAKNLFRGDLVTGPDRVDYSIPALDPGTYYFHCDVHPTMTGTVTVS